MSEFRLLRILHCGTLRRYSTSSILRGQLFSSKRDKALSASNLPPVWHLAQSLDSLLA